MQWISIHKALASLDQLYRLWELTGIIFQSTRLSRASTAGFPTAYHHFEISIHKALASLDLSFQALQPRSMLFQSTRLSRASTLTVTSSAGSTSDFNPQGSREPRQQNYPNLLHIPPNILCIMLFSPQFNQFSPFTQPAFTAFSSVFQVRISLAFHVSLAFAPGLKGSQLTETNSTYILHNPSFPAYILHAAKPLPPPPDTLSIQASFVPDIWLPA